MNKEPEIGKFIDDEEQALYEAIESDDYKLGESALSEDRRKGLKEAAQSTMNEILLCVFQVLIYHVLRRVHCVKVCHIRR